MKRGGNVSQFDEVKFEELYRQEYGKMVAGAKAFYGKMTNGHYISDKPEEAVQETFSLAWTKRQEMFASPKPVGWLYLALRNVLLNMAREDRRWNRVVNTLIDMQRERANGFVSFRWELEGVVSEEDWDLLRRFYAEGYAYKELCQETGLEKSTLAMRIMRTKEKIREAFE